MKQELIEKILQSFTYEELTDDIHEKIREKKKPKASFYKKLGVFLMATYTIAGIFCSLDYIYNYLNGLETDSFVKFMGFFIPGYYLLLIPILMVMKKVIDRVLKDDSHDAIFFESNTYKRGGSLLLFIKNIPYFIEAIDFELIKEDEKISLELYKKLAEKLSKDELIYLAKEKLTYRDLKIIHIYNGIDDKAYDYSIEQFKKDNKDKTLVYTEHDDERPIEEKLIDAIFKDKKKEDKSE